MGKIYYLYVYSITGDEVLNLRDTFKCEEREMDLLLNKLVKYNLFNKIRLIEFNKNYPEKKNEFTIYSILDRKDLALKDSVTKDVKAYLYFLSSLIAKTTHCDMYIENTDVSDTELEILDKITTECINNYINFNILDNDHIGFITVPDRVNEVLNDLNVLCV